MERLMRKTGINSASCFILICMGISTNLWILLMVTYQLYSAGSFTKHNWK